MHVSATHVSTPTSAAPAAIDSSADTANFTAMLAMIFSDPEIEARSGDTTTNGDGTGGGTKETPKSRSSICSAGNDGTFSIAPRRSDSKIAPAGKSASAHANQGSAAK